MPTSAPHDLPIVVDLDGTLVLTDTLHEQIAAGAFNRPLDVLRALARMPRGRAAVKAALAATTDMSVTTLPLRESLVQWLREQARRGRDIHLYSAANQAVVDAVSRRVGIFKTAIGSGADNLKGRAKADQLVKAFPNGFAYAGDSRADLPVWQAADSIILAGAPETLAREVRALNKPVEAEFKNPSLTPTDFVKALRVHHWSKSAFIFVPFILSHAWHDTAAFISTCLGFACLVMVSSATYLLNDIADLDADRRHWSKRHRALASGRLPVSVAIFLAAAFLAVGFAGAYVLSLKFALVLAAYCALTLLYSFRLKRIPLLDTLVIAMLFTLRLVMGIALLNVVYSEWLLTFSLFFFFSLAIAKRHTEIVRAGTVGSHSLANRGYRLDDAPLTLALGVSASIASLVIMVLFIVEEVIQRGTYGNPKALWGIPVALAVWVGRIWLLAHRGEMKDDPVSFALRDKASLVLGCLVAVMFVLSL